LYQKLGAVYKRKAFILYNKDFALAVAAYKSAMDYLARDHDGDPAKASRYLQLDATQSLSTAERILEEQHEAAQEYYQRKLDDALNHYEHMRHRYDRALHDAEREFEMQLMRARQNLENCKRDYQRYMNEGNQQAAEQARQQGEQYERRISYLIMNRHSIIEDDVSHERRQMEQARRDYEHVRNSRREIIDGYLAPYRAKVQEARAHLDMITSFHRSAYENY